MRLRNIRAAALLVSAGASVAVFGTARADDSGVTAPTTTIAAAPATIGAAPTTIAGASALLPPNATLEQIKTAIVGAFGPTTDITGELVPFLTNVPAGIPTPADTVIEEVSVHYFPDTERADSSYAWSQIMFTSWLPAAELVTLYQTGMLAAGFVQTGDSVQDDAGRQIRFLTYDLAAPTTLYDEVTITIVDETEAGYLDFVEIDIYHGLDPALVGIYGSWALAVPLAQSATLEEAEFTTYNFGGDVTLELKNDYVAAVPFPDSLAQFQAGLAATPFILDPASDIAGGSFDLTGGDLAETHVYMSEGFDAGTSYLNITSSHTIAV